MGVGHIFSRRITLPLTALVKGTRRVSTGDWDYRQASDAPEILVAFDEKCFINSTGLAILFECILPLKDQGKDVRIVHPSARFRKVFDIVGLSRDVPVFESEGPPRGHRRHEGRREDQGAAHSEVAAVLYWELLDLGVRRTGISVEFSRRRGKLWSFTLSLRIPGAWASRGAHLTSSSLGMTS